MAFLLAPVMRMSVRIDVPSTNQAEHLSAGVAGGLVEAALFAKREWSGAIQTDPLAAA